MFVLVRWLAPLSLSVHSVFFYQQYAPEMVMWACGHPFVYVLNKPPALLDFLFGRQNFFDCRALDTVQGMPAAGFFARMQFYLDGTVALLWRVLGVSYAALWPLVALLHGAYAAGCFALARLFSVAAWRYRWRSLPPCRRWWFRCCCAARLCQGAILPVVHRACIPGNPRSTARRAIVFAALAGLVVGIGTASGATR